MDPTLAHLALSDRVWVICERARIAQRGEIVAATPSELTVRLPMSQLPPQRYDRASGMRLMGDSRRLSNDFFLKTILPERFHNRSAKPPYVYINQLDEVS